MLNVVVCCAFVKYYLRERIFIKRPAIVTSRLVVVSVYTSSDNALSKNTGPVHCYGK